MEKLRIKLFRKMSEEKPLRLYIGGILTVNEHDTYLLILPTSTIRAVFSSVYRRCTVKTA